MRQSLRFWVPLVALSALVVLLYVGMQDRDRALPSPLIGKPFPALPPTTSAAERKKLESFEGRVRLVNFWASWCQPCLVEHPQLLALAERGVAIIGVNYKDAEADAERWLARHGNPFSVVLRDPRGSFAIDWGVYGVPETYVIDENGTVIYKKVGIVDSRFVREQLPELMGGRLPGSGAGN